MCSSISDMKREVVLAILCAVLFATLILFAFFGCGCKKFQEGFETETKSDTPTLTDQEEELFKDIQSGSLNDGDIQKLVENGKITEEMVEKFLQYLDNMPEPEGEEPVAKTAIKKGPVVPSKATIPEDGFEVEGFAGTMYAPARK